jgi:hypothetical protein
VSHRRWPLLASLLFVCPGIAGPRIEVQVVLRAVQVQKGPRLDGLLNDPVWKEAVPFTGFRQARPAPDNPPSQTTKALILFDSQNLYIGVLCSDTEPAKIAANTMAHDAEDMDESDDNVKILLDPFQDRRTAYFFMVNPRGARTEGLAFGENPSLDWDGLWDARARILNDGWSLEIKIPFKTVSFNPALATWGLNLERYIARRQETDRVSGADLDSHFYNANEAAVLEGIRDVRQGAGITVRPYGLASVDRVPAPVPESGFDTDGTVTGGLDVYKNFTPNFVGALSYNTDFAETEVDERQINLTRFPLYFPEKRTFFLEGSEYFNFGTSGGSGYHSSFIPFFSRRIGLYEGERIPILFGAKVFGRLGKTNISAVDVQTRTFSNPAVSTLPGRNFLAGRVYQNIWAESCVGLVFTNGDPGRAAAEFPGRSGFPVCHVPPLGRQELHVRRLGRLQLVERSGAAGSQGLRLQARLSERPLGYQLELLLLRRRAQARAGFHQPARRPEL